MRNYQCDGASKTNNKKTKMKIHFVASLNSHAGKMAPFIVEQGDALQQCTADGVQCTVEYFGINGKGIKGYLRSLKKLRTKIEEVRPDIIHAHYGLCGLLASLQRQVPVVTTYHGSDINDSKVRPLSRIAMQLSAWNVFISKKTMNLAIGDRRQAIGKKSSLIPCGINMPPEEGDPRITNALLSVSKVLEPGKNHVLFAGAFDNSVKDVSLAKQVVALLNEDTGDRRQAIGQVQLVELKGYTRDEVTALMYACDAFLMTSKTEGSPQVVKEAMACGLPIVSVDVGDVRERLEVRGKSEEVRGKNEEVRGKREELIEGCYVAESREPEELAELLVKALGKVKDNGDRFRTEGRQRIEEMGLRNEEVAKKLIEIYKSVSGRG